MADNKDNIPLTPAQVKALKKAYDEMHKALDKNYEVTQRIQSGWDSISAAFAGIVKSDFFSKLDNSGQISAQITKDIIKQTQILKSSIDAADNSFSNMFKKSKAGRSELKKFSEELTKAISTDGNAMSKDLTDALFKAIKKGGSIGDFLKEQGPIGKKAIEDLIKGKDFTKLEEFLTIDAVKGIIAQEDELKKLQAQFVAVNEPILDIGKAMDKVLSNMTKAFHPEEIKKALIDFDTLIHDTQKDFGIALDKNTTKFTGLVEQTQQFGVGAKEDAEIMGSLANSLRTTNIDFLSKAALDIAPLINGLGLSVDEASELAHQMMFFGKSSNSVKELGTATMKLANQYGINSKKLLQDITKAMPDARALGWNLGAEELGKMAAQAEKLGQNMSDLAASSKKLRTLDSALESSASMALVGVNVNAIQLLGAARRGGVEFSNLVKDMTKGFGQLKETADGVEVSFDAIDIDRLGVMADAMGIPLEKLQDQISKTKLLTKKSDLFKGMVGDLHLNDDEKSFILNAAEIAKGKDGKTLELKVAGIEDLRGITKDQIEDRMKFSKSVEDAAKQNMGFQKSVDAFKGSITNVFTYTQPLLDHVTGMLQGITSGLVGAGPIWQSIFAAGVLGLQSVYSAGKQILAGFFFGKGFNAATLGEGGLLGGLKKGLGFWKKDFWTGGAKAAAKTTAPPISKAYGRNIKGLTGGDEETGRLTKFGKALDSFPDPAKILSIAAAIVAVGIAMIGVGYGIKLASSGLSELVKSFKELSGGQMWVALSAITVVMGGFVGMVYALSTASITSAGPILGLGVAMALIGGAIYVASEGLKDLVTSFNNTANAAMALDAVKTVIYGFGLTLVALGAIAMVPGIAEGLLAISVAAVALGFGIKLAGEGIASMIGSFSNLSTSISKVSASAGDMLEVAVSMGILSAALGVISVTGLTAIPGLLGAAAGITILSFALNRAAPGLTALSKIDFSGLSNLGSTLLPAIGAITAFAASASILGGAIKEIASAGAGGGLVMTAFGFSILGTALNFILPALQVLSQIKADAIVAIGDALSSLKTGLLAVSGLGVLSILGFYSMNRALSTLSETVEKLASPLTQSANAMVTMSDGLTKMKGATAGLDTTSLSKISEDAKKSIESLSGLDAKVAVVNVSIGETKLEPGFIDNIKTTISNAIQSVSDFTTTIKSISLSISDAKLNLDFVDNIKKSISDSVQSISDFLYKIDQIDISVGGAKLTMTFIDNVKKTISDSVQSISELPYNIKQISIYIENIIFESTFINDVKSKIGTAINSLSGDVIKIPSLNLVIDDVKLDEGFLSTIKNTISTAVNSVIPSLQALSEIKVDVISSIGDALSNLKNGLMSIGSIGILSFPGFALMNHVLSDLSDTIVRLASPLDMASTAMMRMSDGIVSLKSAITGLDTSALNKIADYSGKFSVTSGPAVIVPATAPTIPQKPVEVDVKPIKIDLRLNGRQMHEMIGTDHYYSL